MGIRRGGADMEEPRITGRQPTAWTWIVGTLIVVAIVWTVFAMIARRHGSANQSLPGAHVPGSSMVALCGALETASGRWGGRDG